MSTGLSDPPKELAPSEVREVQPVVARLAGAVGLFLLVVGAVTVVARQYGYGLLPEAIGYLFVGLGLALLFVHAVRDNDIEVRRLYGALAVLIAVAALPLALLGGVMAARSDAGAAGGVRWALAGVGWFGGLLGVGAVAFGLWRAHAKLPGRSVTWVAVGAAGLVLAAAAEAWAGAGWSHWLAKAVGWTAITAAAYLLVQEAAAAGKVWGGWTAVAVGGLLLLLVAEATGVIAARTQLKNPDLLLYWAALAGLISLIFFVPFARNETEEPLHTGTLYLMLAVGAALSVGAVVGGIVRPESLVGPGVALGLLGLGFIAGFLANVDAADGVGLWAACGLGVLGAVALGYAVGRSVFPTVLHDGPQVLRTATLALDTWAVVGRAAMVLLGLAVSAAGLMPGLPTWARVAAVVAGQAWAWVFGIASYTAPLTAAPAAFFVPHGLLLGILGLLFLAVSVGVWSDATVVVLTRRELAAYFYSPLAYVVLFAMAAVAWIGYCLYVLFSLQPGTRALMEPILTDYWGAHVGAAFGTLFLVPALTMRAFSEEKRSGTLEVLFTAPVSEFPVVLSKWFAGVCFFLLAWLPVGLYLLALRVEGGSYFDYRPLLTYYLALLVCGMSFVAMGVFFSSVTNSQVVAGVLTFMVMFGMLLTIAMKGFPVLGAGLKAAVGRLDYLSLWQSALAGRLAATDLLLHASLTVFWLFLTVKVLEARKWS